MTNCTVWQRYIQSNYLNFNGVNFNGEIGAILKQCLDFSNRLNGTMVLKITVQILTDKLNEFQTIGRGTECY